MPVSHMARPHPHMHSQADIEGRQGSGTEANPACAEGTRPRPDRHQVLGGKKRWQGVAGALELRSLLHTPKPSCFQSAPWG